MASLHITRDNELIARQVACDVLQLLKEKHPDQEFEFDADKIKGKNQVVYLSNLTREVRAAPRRKDKIIKRFVETLSQPAAADFGHETWEEARGCVVPVLKPRDYVERDGPTRHFFVNEWLSDVLICYAIKHKNMFRFVTSWDLGRWGCRGRRCTIRRWRTCRRCRGPSSSWALGRKMAASSW